MGLAKDVVVIKHLPICTRHSHNKAGFYDERYDSYFCEICNRWLEEPCKCGGNDCKWFPKRPDKPLKKKEKVENEHMS